MGALSRCPMTDAPLSVAVEETCMVVDAEPKEGVCVWSKASVMSGRGRNCEGVVLQYYCILKASRSAVLDQTVQRRSRKQLLPTLKSVCGRVEGRNGWHPTNDKGKKVVRRKAVKDE